MKSTNINGKNMTTTTNSFAGRLVLTLLALFSTTIAWGQLRGSGTEQDPYLINDAADWATFTSNVNKKGEGLDSYYELTNDITLGTTTEPLTTVIGTSKNPFKGTLNGNFHTIHLNMLRDANYAALFGFVECVTIKNLHVDGYIKTDHKFAAAFIAWADNKSGSTNLINCISSVNINCDDIIQYIIANKPYDCTHGGLVGQNESGTTNFVNCIFDGSIIDSKKEQTANKCTGFIGWVNKKVTYTNCTMAGIIDVVDNTSTLTNSMANFHRLALKDATAIFDDNTYYINNYSYSNDIQGKEALQAAPKNTICKVYNSNVSKETLYVPGAVIDNNKVTYYGWTLKQGVDYEVEVLNTSTENKMVYKGINNYGGSFSTDIDPTYQINVTTWDATTKTGWHAISSPVNEQSFATTNHLITAAKHNIYRYDEEKRMWQEYRYEDNIFNYFENGRGYIYRTEENDCTIGFNGTTNTGDIDCKMTYTEKTDNLNGLNLIGNPYLHDIYKGISIPNEKLTTGYCTLTVNGTWEYTSDSKAISAGTAIMVQVDQKTKGDCTITIKDTDEAPASKANNDEIWFTVKNNEFEDVAHIEFKDGHGFNKMSHYNEEAPMLYVNKDGEHYASADLNEGTDVINLSFKATKMDKYTISVKANGSFDYLHIIDKLTGNDVDMLVEDEYSFIATSNDNADRFIVKLNSNTMNETFEYSQFAWQNGNNVIVNGEGELQIFDITGRMVMNNFINGEETIYIPTTGVFVFRLLGNDMKTQKIVVR